MTSFLKLLKVNQIERKIHYEEVRKTHEKI